ncbi:hypothetical protein C3L33_20497, partial [Rhododendron williamsianum]
MVMSKIAGRRRGEGGGLEGGSLIVGQIPDRLDKNWLLTDYVWGCYGKKTSPAGDSTNTKTRCSPSDCVLWVFGNKLVNSSTKEEEEEGGGEEDRRANYYHILHKVHDGFLPLVQAKQKASVSDEEVVMPSASELYFAGVKFVPDASGYNLFKFKFTEPKGLFWRCRRAFFVMPPLMICDETEVYLRNLIAFEQCCPGVSQYVTSYALVMDMLVNSDRDVQVLEKAGVLFNYLGAREDVTDLFNKLCKEIAFGESFFADACIKATQYSKRFWPKNMLHLRRTYFSSPWTFIAFCVGFIVFVMSFVEFVRSFLK